MTGAPTGSTLAPPTTIGAATTTTDPPPAEPTAKDGANLNGGTLTVDLRALLRLVPF